MTKLTDSDSAFATSNLITVITNRWMIRTVLCPAVAIQARNVVVFNISSITPRPISLPRTLWPDKSPHLEAAGHIQSHPHRFLEPLLGHLPPLPKHWPLLLVIQPGLRLLYHRRLLSAREQPTEPVLALPKAMMPAPRHQPEVT